MFDTHRAVKELTDAGFALEQAEAVVATVSVAVNENVATKLDIAETRAEAKGDIAELKSDIAELRAEMKAMEMRIMVRMTGIGLTIAGLSIALLKLLP